MYLYTNINLTYTIWVRDTNSMRVSFSLIQILYGGKSHIPTHWHRDIMAAIFQTTFSNAFSLTKMYQFQLKFRWSMFRSVHLTTTQHWFRKWLGVGQETSNCLKQCWLVYRRIYTSLSLNESSHHINRLWTTIHFHLTHLSTCIGLELSYKVLKWYYLNMQIHV